jgi:hypothetical protein
MSRGACRRRSQVRFGDPQGPWRSKARAALDTAASLGIAETSAYKAYEGLYQWVFEGHFDRAETLLREAFLAGDDYGTIFYLRLLASSGIHDPLLPMFERLTVTEPYKGLHWELLAQELAFRGDLQGAAESRIKAMELLGLSSYFELGPLMSSTAGQLTIISPFFVLSSQ